MRPAMAKSTAAPAQVATRMARTDETNVPWAPSTDRWFDSPTVDERALELGAETLHLVGEVRRARGIGDVVEPHGVTLPERRRDPADGAPSSWGN